MDFCGRGVWGYLCDAAGELRLCWNLPFSLATSWQEFSRFHPADSLTAAQPILWAFLIQQEERQNPVKSCQGDLLFTYH